MIEGGSCGVDCANCDVGNCSGCICESVGIPDCSGCVGTRAVILITDLRGPSPCDGMVAISATGD